LAWPRANDELAKTAENREESKVLLAAPQIA
jgi:hypothetical protein